MSPVFQKNPKIVFMHCPYSHVFTVVVSVLKSGLLYLIQKSFSNIFITFVSMNAYVKFQYKLRYQISIQEVEKFFILKSRCWKVDKNFVLGNLRNRELLALDVLNSSFSTSLSPA